MKVFIKDIPQEGLSFTFSAKKEDWFKKVVRESFADLFRAEDTAVGKILCTRNGENVHVVGSVEVSFHPLCSRCNNPFQLSLNIPIEILFSPAYSFAEKEKEEEKEEEVELVEEDLNFCFYDGKMLDLGEQIREQMILAIPQQPLCREDCQGLCPQCGIDRNTNTCRCSEKSADSRWNALKTLKTLSK